MFSTLAQDLQEDMDKVFVLAKIEATRMSVNKAKDTHMSQNILQY